MGWSRDCTPSLAGVVEFYATCWIDTDDVTVTDDVVTGFPDGTTFTKFEQVRFTANMANALTYNDATGLSYWTNSYNGNFVPMNATSRAEMEALKNSDLSIVVRDANGVYWYMGYNNYVKMTDAAGDTGAGLDDANQYTFTLTDYSSALPLTLSPAAIAIVKGTTPTP